MDANGSRQQRLGAVKAGAWPPKPATPGYKLENNGSATEPDMYILTALKTGRRLRLTVPDPGVYGNDALLPMPGGGLVYAANQQEYHEPGELVVCARINVLLPGKLRYLTDWQNDSRGHPKGRAFVACVVERNTTSYALLQGACMPLTPATTAQERSDRRATKKRLYVAALQIRTAQDAARLKANYTRDCRWVTGADWRKGSQVRPCLFGDCPGWRFCWLLD